MNVHISSDAEADLIEGYWFYERQSPGLGEYFRSCLISDIESLAYHAGIHEVAFDYHRSLSKRFPFTIYYHIEGDSATVVAVLDARRNPQWIRKRLG
jgi:plasmid stabilization system protein ParE